MPLIFAHPKAEEYYENALACESGEQWQEAIDNYNLAAAADPAHPELWYRLGQLLARPESSEDCGCRGYRQAMKCAATTAEQYYWRAKATDAYAECIHEDYESEIIADYSAAISIDPTNTRYLEDRGQFSQRKGHLAEALADYDTLLAHEPGNATYYLHRGQLYQQHDQLAAAMADYNASLALAHSEAAFKARGVLFLLAHDFRNALKSFGLKKGTHYNWWDINPDIRYPAPDQPTPTIRWVAAVRALEASGLIDVTHPRYLRARCEYYLSKADEDPGPGQPDPTLLALADADALIAIEFYRLEYRQLRVACRLALGSPSMIELAHDYLWLVVHASKLPKAASGRPHLQDARYAARLKQAEYQHKYAWAQFKAYNDTAAQESFDAAVEAPLHDNYQKNLAVCRDLATFRAFLPPLPAEDYLLWQIRQQFQRNREGFSTHLQVKSWLTVAIAALPWPLARVLTPAFDKYKSAHLIAGTYFVHPRTAAHYSEALASCTEGAQQAPEIADIFVLMHLNILKGQLREALNQPGATPASKEAALAYYDDARAEWAAPQSGPRDSQL